MDSQTITLTLPFNAQQFWVFTIALSLMALSGGIALFSGKRVEKDRLPKDWLRNSLLIAGGLLAPIWAALLFMVLTGLWHLAWKMPQVISSADDALRWHALAIVGLITSLVGILGAPLAMIRVVMTERQTRATEEGLVTDRINKAVEGLGAVREVKDYDVSSTEPNLEVRIGAIKSLERIAEDSERDRATVIDLLSYYMRGNIKRNNPDPPSADTPYDAKVEFRSSQHRILDEDCYMAIEIVQKLKRKDAPLNLHSTAICAVDFSSQELARANFSGSALFYSSFNFAQLDHCTFTRSKLTMSDFSFASLKNSRFVGSRCYGSIFEDSDLSGAYFSFALFDEHTNFEGANLTGAAFYHSPLEDVEGLSQLQLDNCFAFACGTLPQNLKQPAHWPTEYLPPDDFYRDWRAWQRTIGFQPDENQQ